MPETPPKEFPKQQLSKEIQQAVAEITGRWGVKVERVDIMEISLPKSLERSLAIEAETVREARARVILAEGEAKASQFLKESSDVMSDNQITLQLRHLQVLSSLAPERHVTVIFPIPLAIMEPFNDENENEQNEDDKRRKDDDRDDQLDYLHMFSPKVVISGTPPEEDKKWSRFWKWPPFGTTRGPDDGERPSGSQRGRTGNQQPSSSRRADRTADSDPYPLLPQPETSTKSVAGIPIPPRPDPPSLPPLPRHPKPPSLPPIPPHPNLPPVPPHPRLPPLPDKPAPPPKPTSSSK
ncbi:fibronectin-binding protein A isoform X2 [Drosophila ficusphila]|uniref:fibronectin-binding protein A isoform X2 n=1 Tax=Drosophila ficusphila TaxID=30025 RepID=UPI0007E8286E|nr:fibronectin-binding protein A isoform X2 [Drosophila ficusphila]